MVRPHAMSRLASRFAMPSRFWTSLGKFKSRPLHQGKLTRNSSTSMTTLARTQPLLHTRTLSTTASADKPPKNKPNEDDDKQWMFGLAVIGAISGVGVYMYICDIMSRIAHEDALEDLKERKRLIALMDGRDDVEEEDALPARLPSRKLSQSLTTKLSPKSTRDRPFWKAFAHENGKT